MQNISVKPNFNVNDIKNKNILIPNFNYNYNFNLGQLKPVDDPNKIDLYNNSLMIFDQLQNTYSNNTISANEIYRTYNYSLKNLRENSKNLKLEDISKRAHFYFYLYNLINKKKCQQISNEEYKCSFLNTNLPFQPNNKKIQININNPLFNLNNLNSYYKQNQPNNNLYNGAIMNNGLYAYNNKNNLLNNSMSTASGSNMNNNFLFSFDNKNKNQFLEKKRNSEKNNLNIDSQSNNMNNMSQNSNKKKKKKNRNKNKNKNKNNIIDAQEKEKEKQENQNITSNNTSNNNINQDKNNNKKKKESPMIQIEKNDLKIKKLKQINKSKNNSSKNNQEKDSTKNNNNIQNEIKTLEYTKEKKELQLFEKDLKDYLKRTMSDIRKDAFFKNVLPQSVKFMKNLFNKGCDVQINQMYPIYRNHIEEISLKIEPGGRIKINKNQLKE